MTLDDLKALLVGRTIADVEDEGSGYGPVPVGPEHEGGQMGEFVLVLDDGARIWGYPAFWTPGP